MVNKWTEENSNVNTHIYILDILDFPFECDVRAEGWDMKSICLPFQLEIFVEDIPHPVMDTSGVRREEMVCWR